VRSGSRHSGRHERRGSSCWGRSRQDAGSEPSRAGPQPPTPGRSRLPRESSRRLPSRSRPGVHGSRSIAAEGRRAAHGGRFQAHGRDGDERGELRPARVEMIGASSGWAISVRVVMNPRTDVQALPATATVAERWPIPASGTRAFRSSIATRSHPRRPLRQGPSRPRRRSGSPRRAWSWRGPPSSS